jgi:hypothetical protein
VRGHPSAGCWLVRWLVCLVRVHSTHGDHRGTMMEVHTSSTILLASVWLHVVCCLKTKWMALYVRRKGV